eukprot:TRINITY_DN3399_c0_g1_i3.p1 TRINITY_DN3399_c0_g1~~TRINITY_DN3399_c0_g1_i3.p1  ORF type:complete len:151 (+),score=6.43 TRINITY_DN3399_c0_g1_i3:786-1238(+)
MELIRSISGSWNHWKNGMWAKITIHIIMHENIPITLHEMRMGTKSGQPSGILIVLKLRNFNCFETHGTTHTPTHTHYPSNTAIKTFTPNVSLRIFATSLRSEVSSSCMAAINGVLDHHRKENSLEGTFSRTFSLLLVQSSKPFRSSTMTL